MDIDIEKQRTFIQTLREGYVMTSDTVEATYGVDNSLVFVKDIIKRTGLDIRIGRMGGWNILDLTVYYIVDDVRQESAGLDEMYEATEEIMSDIIEPVEYQDGYYIMWVCPTLLPTKEGAECCGKFHKVDLGDEPLTVSKTVQCVQCGRKYQIAPREI